MPATWSIQTPTGSAGAVAVVQLAAATADDLEATLRQLGIRSVPVGGVALRNLCGVDEGLVARWSESIAHLMPHGGAAVLRMLSQRLAASGLEQSQPDPRQMYPEARTDTEARMLDALARAASPMAIDLLLDQPLRWSEAGAASDPERDRILSRLIEPPLVVAIGAPNIGKSSLANALAGRRVSLVADQPGTTRDHVGVMIELAGLVVRYVDTPGTRATGDAIETEARAIAEDLVGSADLVLRCGDRSAPPPLGPSTPSGRPGPSTLAVALRADLGAPGWPSDAMVSALTGAGIPALVKAVRDALVPESVRREPGPWKFWRD